jgi:hypothetical protein
MKTHAPHFVVGDTIGLLKVAAFLPKDEVDCECLGCGKHIKRLVATLNHAKALQHQSSCKTCMKTTRRRRATIVSRAALPGVAKS